ncbi:uncharacterized protein PG998_006217 [Apiospora kogelbergensis]|uniref:uncharacterized protein n=1 Tax=Apiospora kogelbergensis TaxID=1337665 RepID=UPI00312FC2D2
MSLTTSTISRDGTAYALPPQTTPFTYQWAGTAADNPCSSASIYCQFVVGQDTKPFDQLVCTQGFATTAGSSTSFDRSQGACFPLELLRDADPDYPPDKDLTSAAYEGSACIQGWDTACTADIIVTATSGSSGGATTSRQVWCCAPGYSCTTASADWGDSSTTTAPFERHCYSFLNTPTVVWASWDPPPPSLTARSITPPQNKYTVFHRPLPLAVSAWVGGEGDKAEGAATRTAAASGASIGPSK